MQSPFFSLILLIRQMRHLLPTTLDTLRVQTEKGFEVVLLDGEGEVERLQELSLQYPELAFQIRSTAGQTAAAMMNEGVECARGTYLQFLMPGDRFLSQQGLSYLRTLLHEQKEPHLVSSSFLVQGADASLQAVPFLLSRETLQRGSFSPLSRTMWFLKDVVVEMGGFNAAFSYRSSFDFLCRLLQKPGVRVVCSRRVLTDAEPRRLFSRELLGHALETCQILYRHFGVWPMLRWFFVQEHLIALKRSFFHLCGLFRKSQ